MEYNFREIEKKWQQSWRHSGAYKVSNPDSNREHKPKFYVLDMFPYPSGAGLHVGHPLGYIASDIYARFKRLKGFNVLHPMGFDSFGLPAEQYALETGQHPAVTTEKNIARYKEQLDNIGFCYDWSREVRTSDPKYYRWTQWIFLQLFDSWYNRKTEKAERISALAAIFEKEGNANNECPGDRKLQFTAEEWKAADNERQREILMDYRLAFSAFGEVNWCEALGTVLANDEVINGVSERGGHPVVKKKMRQWYLRITEYADRLLQGLEQVDFSDSMKEMQRNWIGKSQGAEITFRLTPSPSPHGEGGQKTFKEMSGHFFKTGNQKFWKTLKVYGRDNRKNETEAEDLLWQNVRNNKLNIKVRRQHAIEGFIADFALTEIKLVIEIDGNYHNEEEQQEYDKARTRYLKEFGFDIIRFTNTEILQHTQSVVETIKKEIQSRRTSKHAVAAVPPLLREEKGSGDEATLRVYTTRPDTIFGVDFMVIAPEHELVPKITSPQHKLEISTYLTYVKSRSERERLAEVKSITGAFTGAYALNPFNGREIPIWISEYVLAGYGTGAIMAVPCGDQRDFAFAKHFNIPITNIIGEAYNGEEANPTKDAILQNSDFLDGMVMRDAIDVVIDELEEMGIGKRQVNYRMRDAGFSRQRYWGEPFPIVYKGGVAFALDESLLPVELPYVDTYSAGPEGEGPLANLKEWVLIPDPSPQVEKGEGSSFPAGKSENTGVGAALVPKYSVHTPMQYELAKQMRKEYTEAEGILWEALRGEKLEVKFRRQHPIDAYIADFICLQKRLIVEVDGGYHETKEQQEYDQARTKVLEEIGFKVIRFTNNAVVNDLKTTVQKIKEAIAEPKILPGQKAISPLSTRGEAEGLLSPISTCGEGPGVKETNTMPGYAGSSWYFLRYMDPHNDQVFADRKATDYWNQVDLYIGGTEHAVGHLLYSRLWTKVLFDLGYIGFDEPYKKLLNQGMIQGSSRFVYRLAWKINLSGDLDDSKLPHLFLSKGVADKIELEEAEAVSKLTEIASALLADTFPDRKDIGIRGVGIVTSHVDVSLVDGYELDIKAFRLWRNGMYANAQFLYENGLKTESEEKKLYLCGGEVEKMSKSKYNVVNPDEIVERYGADTFRMYEMFLGPVEQSKPWDTKGIEGVHRFLRKFWRLFADETKGLIVTNDAATPAELKVLHKTIKKIEEDTERFSFNTAVSAFMVCVNELNDVKCHKREILEPLLILLTPYAPHIAEELYQLLKNNGNNSLSPGEGRGEVSVLDATFPTFEEKHLVESSKEYPISINGKHRTNINISLDATQPEVEQIVVANEVVQKWLDGKAPKKIIFVKGKMINVVI